MNMSNQESYNSIGSLLRVLGHPMRIKILLEIGTGEACVCHLEEKLNIRQAYLSQHLMTMREENILGTHREGRFIYYRIKNPGMLDLINTAGEINGISMSNIHTEKKPCSCPKCVKEN